MPLRHYIGFWGQHSPDNSEVWETGIMNGRDALVILGPHEDANKNRPNGLDDDAEKLIGIQIMWVQGRKRPG